MFRCEGRYYKIAAIKGEGVRVLEATPSEVLAAREWGEDIPAVGISIEQIEACVWGPSMLVRAQQVAALGAARFAILFGTFGSTNQNYAHARNLRWIGRRIPPPEPPPRGGCGKCMEVTKACSAGCARRIVHQALKSATFAMLSAAAQHTDPFEQLQAALDARVSLECAPRKRKPREGYVGRVERNEDLDEQAEGVDGRERFPGR
jgi:hypothetical protein